ncbi:MAG TPA: CRISPR-associated ring nuclease [Ktedonobacteraceae bacterium]|nr:CRISPR-associated ring nuclease [Ktedonobacteraceae bacterium]
MPEYHQTLIAPVGGQPQIITLTLDLLLRQGIKISEVIILHPAPTDARIQHTLRCLRAEFAHDRYTCDERTITCRLQFQALSHDNIAMPDITDTAGAHATRDTIHRLLRRLKQQQRHIHLSASGGRRVISLMAISAALLHFDHFDHIWHIYTPPDIRALVNEGAVMHVPPEAGVELIEVPFVPWGAYFPQLSQMVGSAQAIQRAQTAILDAQDQARCAEMLQQTTPAQQQVLRQVSAGLTPREVAARLSLSRETIYSHTKALLSLAHNIWYLPAGEKIDFNFLFRKFAGYFGETEEIIPANSASSITDGGETFPRRR